MALAVFDLNTAARLRHVLIAVCLLGQAAASAVLTYQLYQFKGRMAAHRDQIYSATAQHALVVGPGEWSKLFFPRDGTNRVRSYASYAGAMQGPGSGDELLRLVEQALQDGQPAYVLGSGSKKQPTEERARRQLNGHYRLVTVLDSGTPYELRVNQVLPR